MTRTEKLVLDCLEIRRKQLRQAVVDATHEVAITSKYVDVAELSSVSGISRHAVYRALIELGYTVDAPTDAPESEES
jgi:hypothetical protein